MPSPAHEAAGCRFAGLAGGDARAGAVVLAAGDAGVEVGVERIQPQARGPRHGLALGAQAVVPGCNGVFLVTLVGLDAVHVAWIRITGQGEKPSLYGTLDQILPAGGANDEGVGAQIVGFLYRVG